MQSYPWRHRRRRQKHHLPLQQRSGGNQCGHRRRHIGIRDSRQLRRRWHTCCKRQESGYTAGNKRHRQIRLRSLRTRPNQYRPQIPADRRQTRRTQRYRLPQLPRQVTTARRTIRLSGRFVPRPRGHARQCRPLTYRQSKNAV